MDSSTFDALVTDFYRAATGVVGWEQALEQVRLAFRARCSPLQTVDARTGRVIVVHAGGPDMDRPTLDYVRTYHQIDPRTKIGLSLPLCTWVHCHEHMDEEFVARDRFFQDFLTSFDSRYVSGVVIPLDAQMVAIWGIQRPAREGPLDPDERVWAQRLGEHLREALKAYERVRRLAAEALSGHVLLSRFPYPMWLIDAERFVFFTNPAAEQEMQAGERIALRGPRLALIDGQADRRLSLQVEALRQAGHGASAVIDLRRRLSDPPAWLHLFLLVPGEVLGAFGEQPQILATLFDPGQISRLDPFALANLFKLTPAEARVATQLADGLAADDIAVQNNTRVSTVRMQIRNVLAKLGVARQADAVRILRQGEALWAQECRQGT